MDGETRAAQPPRNTAWPHAPRHQLSVAGTFIVTSGTYGKEHHFAEPARLDVLQRGLLAVAAEFGWHLEAWAIFSNHYHFVGHSPSVGESDLNAESLGRMLGRLHAKTAGWINGLDKTPGRKVWHNFWETRLTNPTSYFARLKYVQQNPVRHGLADEAREYPWCSARWFEAEARPAQVRTIYGFPVDRIKVLDDYSPVLVRR